MNHEQIEKKYSINDFKFNKKIKKWVSYDKKIKLDDGEIYFIYESFYGDESIPLSERDRLWKEVHSRHGYYKK